MNTTITIIYIAICIPLVFYFANKDKYTADRYRDYRLTSGYTKQPRDPDSYSEYSKFKIIVDKKAYSNNTRFIANAIVPIDDGTFAEIDLIAISEYGFDLYEFKNYKKPITGDLAKKEWNYCGRTINSPLTQSFYHLSAFKRYCQKYMTWYPYSYMTENIVVFNKIEANGFDKSSPINFVNYVIRSGEPDKAAKTNKKGREKIFTEEQIDNIFYDLRDLYKYNPQERETLIQTRAYSSGYSKPKHYSYFAIRMPGGSMPANAILRYSAPDRYELCLNTENRIWLYYPELTNSSGPIGKIGGPFRDFREAAQCCSEHLPF